MQANAAASRRRSPATMSIDLKHLRYADAAARHGSFRKAADSLSLKQSNLSRRIRHLEEQLGLELFERTNGGVRPTTTGRDFLVGVRRVLDESAFGELRRSSMRRILFATNTLAIIAGLVPVSAKGGGAPAPVSRFGPVEEYPLALFGGAHLQPIELTGLCKPMEFGEYAPKGAGTRKWLKH